MNITHIAIHELEKEVNKTGATLTLFDSTVDKSVARVSTLLSELNNRYKNRNETYAVFDNVNPTVFHTSFENYNRKRTESDFVNFTKQASQDLRTRIEGIAPAKGGYLIFAHYEQNRKYVAVFLVRNTIGMSLRKDTTKKRFDIDDVIHIDFENLAMACRISLDAYRKKDVRYLCFINKKSDDMSQYFTRWISSSDTESNEEDTKILLDILNKVTLPIDEETNQPIERFVLLDRAFTNIKGTPGRIVSIRNLSESLFGDAEYLANYIEQNELIINGEFKAHPKTLRKFVRVRAKADDIELTFPYTAYKNIVRFDQIDPTQIIIRSEKLVEVVKTMLSDEE